MSTIVQFPGLGIELPITRVAFSIGSFDVYWYGVILGLGLALGMIWALKNTREFGVDQDKFIDLLLVGTVAGIIGARLYYVAFAQPGEFTSFWQIFDLRRGGVAFYGAVIFGLGSAILMCRKTKVRFLPVADLASVGFLIGQGIGRWGNFFNQEAFGANTTLPWGMTSDTVRRYLANNLDMLAQKGITVDPALPVHPTFLYESLWCALGFILISRYIKKRKFDGEITLLYFAWNGFGRAIIEGLRTDSLYLGGIRISQMLAIVGCAASVIAVLVIRNKIKSAPDKNYLVPYGHTDECARELAAIADERAAQKRGEEKPDSGDSAPIAERLKGLTASFGKATVKKKPIKKKSEPAAVKKTEAVEDIKLWPDSESTEPASEANDGEASEAGEHETSDKRIYKANK